MDLPQIQRAKKWPTPNAVKDVEVFLGLAKLYQQFIKQYSNVVQSPTALFRNEEGKDDLFK